jgi:hypothetical protein
VTTLVGICDSESNTPMNTYINTNTRNVDIGRVHKDTKSLRAVVYRLVDCGNNVVGVRDPKTKRQA